ncbi:Coiled-coil domain-containing protein 85C-A [Geodia barretti]|uniref:Coiled-coil domain-containing protein 85C-A n=1 Tax=Geodia barretti TaxID=519541 RepID=A0AA35W2U8_GEOBA|nr:Coiled-coil domain-containing protein 85C-A [Geodia barretti]
METAKKLTAEVHLLRKLCRSLDAQRKKSHQEAVEWQNFGRFTAGVLQKEVEGFERKLRVLQERMDGLVRENGELQEMCFYLDKTRQKSSAEGVDARTTAGTTAVGRTGGTKQQGSLRVPMHSMCAEEMNKDSGPPLQYAGITSDNTLRDKKGKNKFNLLDTKDPQATVTMLQKRLEKLESEKLELVKVGKSIRHTQEPA